MRAVLDADAELEDFAAITTPTLMLSGGWSPGYFADTSHQLADAVPAVSFAVVPGQLHEGPIRPGSRLALRTARFLRGGPGAAAPPPVSLAGSLAAAGVPARWRRSGAGR
jgi:hypothetical protein